MKVTWLREFLTTIVRRQTYKIFLAETQYWVHLFAGCSFPIVATGDGEDMIIRKSSIDSLLILLWARDPMRYARNTRLMLEQTTTSSRKT